MSLDKGGIVGGIAERFTKAIHSSIETVLEVHESVRRPERFP
jgi:hypothetical protein